MTAMMSRLPLTACFAAGGVASASLAGGHLRSRGAYAACASTVRSSAGVSDGLVASHLGPPGGFGGRAWWGVADDVDVVGGDVVVVDCPRPAGPGGEVVP